ERQPDVERRVTVYPNAPPGGPQVPDGLDVGGAVPRRGEAHDVGAVTVADDRRALRGDRPFGELAGDQPCRSPGRRDLTRARPPVDRTAGGRREHPERRTERAEEVRRPAGVERVDRLAESHLL